MHSTLEYTVIATADLAFQSSPLQHLLADPIDEALCQSIKEYGLIQPLLVQADNSGRTWIVLCGTRQLRAARKAGISQLPCMVLDANALPWQKYALIALHAHQGSIVASPVEDALLIAEAQQTLPETEQFSLLKLLGYKPNRHQLNDLLALLDMDDTAIEALHAGLISVKTAKKIRLLSHPDQATLIDVITTFHFGGSKQQQCVQMVVELSRRRGCSTQEVIDSVKTEKSRDAKNIPQQGNKLLERLQQEYAPAYSAAEKSFQEFVNSLNLPEHFQLRHSPAFEKDSCELIITFANTSALQASIKDLQRRIPAPNYPSRKPTNSMKKEISSHPVD